MHKKKQTGRWKMPYVLILVAASAIVVGARPGVASFLIAFIALGIGTWAILLNPDRVAKETRRR